jgi:hypothetical protein
MIFFIAIYDTNQVGPGEDRADQSAIAFDHYHRPG